MKRTTGLLVLLLATALLPACDGDAANGSGTEGGPTGTETGGTEPNGEEARPGVAEVTATRSGMDEAAKPHFDRGVDAARAAITEGRATIQTLGLPDFSAGEMDEDTGLPTENRGCVIDDEIGGFVSGWNAEMRRALDAGELEGASLRHKLTTHAALLERFAADAGQPIAPGGESVTSPDGRYRIESAAHPTLDSEYLWAVDTQSGERRELLFYGGAARLLFDHDGTTLLVRDEGYGSLQTFDLPSALFMQGFEIE